MKKILSILVLISSIILIYSCSSSSPELTLYKPFLIQPSNGLLTSSRMPFFIFRHTNSEIDGIYYDFILSESHSFSEILYYKNNIIPDSESYIIQIPHDLEQNNTYYFRSTARITGSNDYISSDIYSINIEFIGNNHPNLYMNVGDSITDSDFPGQNYSDFLEELLIEYFGSSARTVNEGIGALYAHELKSLINIFLRSNQPAYTTILIGINDLRHPAGCPEPYNCRTIEDIIDIAVYCASNGTIPLVCTLIPAVGYNGIVYDEQIREFNNKLKSECNALGIETIDLYSAISSYSGHIEELYDDDIHPNIKGNQYIAEIIFEHLSNRTIGHSQYLIHTDRIKVLEKENKKTRIPFHFR